MKKICTTCKVEKTTDQFYGQSSGKYGVAALCKSCQSDRARAYRERDGVKEKMREAARLWNKDNPEKVRNHIRKWVKNNPEKVRENARIKSKAYREKNKEKEIKRRRLYYINNKDKVDESCKRWQTNNPDKVYAKYQRRRKAMSDLPGSHTYKEWQDLCDKHDNKCLCCKEEKKLTADHVIPVSWEGSSNNISNIQPLCISCNCSKGNRSAADYRSR